MSKDRFEELRCDIFRVRRRMCRRINSHFASLSTMTQIASCPSDTGRPVMKSMDTISQHSSEIKIGIISPFNVRMFHMSRLIFEPFLGFSASSTTTSILYTFCELLDEQLRAHQETRARFLFLNQVCPECTAAALLHPLYEAFVDNKFVFWALFFPHLLEVLIFEIAFLNIFFHRLTEKGSD